MDSKQIKFKVISDIYWDNWGRFVKVFCKGNTYTGTQYPSGIITAESPYYDGVSDIVDLRNIEIL